MARHAALQFPPGRFGLATIIREGRDTPAVVTDHGAVVLADVLGGDVPSSVRALLDGWDGWCDRVAAALESGVQSWLAIDEVTFAAPLPDPTNIYLAGANYYDHILEMNAYAAKMMGDKPVVPTDDKPLDEVFHFMVPTASLVGTGHSVIRPSGADQLDWEVELAVVIGRRADAVSVDDALDHVAGYTVANDVSVRGPATMHPIFGVRFLEAKGQATLTPMGPAIVPARFVPDPNQLSLSTVINGEVRQDSNTAQMVSTVRQQIAVLSGRAPLLPGDIILTGTPAGTAAAYGSFLRDGDVITMTVEGLGSLVNTIAATPA